jgi:hypothetical protein
MTLFIIHMSFLLTLLITAAIALSKFRSTILEYKPMLIFFVCTFVLETLIFIGGHNPDLSRVLVQVQVITGFLLVCWQARLLKIFKNDLLKIFKNDERFKKFMNGMFTLWVLNMIFKPFKDTSVPVVGLVYALIIIVIAIEILKRQLNNVGQPLVQNSIVLFSLGLISYYTLNVVLDLFLMIGKDAGENVLGLAYIIYIALAIVTNFLYIKAAVCLPKLTN